MNLAEPVDSLGVFERLCSTVMDSPSLGARVLAALIPASYPDPREVGVRVGHGTAHGVLEKSGERHTDGDAWVLTAMLLVPRATVHTRPPAEIIAAAWAPQWFVRLAIPLGMSWREAV